MFVMKCNASILALNKNWIRRQSAIKIAMNTFGFQIKGFMKQFWTLKSANQINKIEQKSHYSELDNCVYFS